MSKILCMLGYYESIFNKNNHDHNRCTPLGVYGAYVSIKPFDFRKQHCLTPALKTEHLIEKE